MRKRAEYLFAVLVVAFGAFVSIASPSKGFGFLVLGAAVAAHARWLSPRMARWRTAAVAEAAARPRNPTEAKRGMRITGAVALVLAAVVAGVALESPRWQVALPLGVAAGAIGLYGLLAFLWVWLRADKVSQRTS